ncbi:Hsp20/alpha crystallin family protein [Aquimarina celericrescens]|uniref:Hsp20/alpha crystallin family protein n=1 Tax=Aquimarina celericrescens TaxID=1964542 RepID=A0ABW5AT58_9FLAO|nr:Hsp20/alpha crystallin family protein [Aquimarina celericrescens]
MSLIKFRRRPWSSILSSDFFDGDDFFENRLLDTKLFNNRFWNGKLREPALNIIETDNNFEIELAAPGFSKKDFEVTIEDGCLNISAEKSVSKKEEEGNYKRREFSYNSFERSLVLPESVKEEDVKAKYKDGILSFSLAKKEEARKPEPKVIEIA